MSKDQSSKKILQKDPASYWLESTSRTAFPQLDKDIDVEVAIVGGGITGITAAYALVKEGFDVAVIEASSLLSGTTGHTTAKISAQHGLIYDELINHFGMEQTKLYYQANMEARKFIEECIQLHGIECEFQTEDAYIYTNDQTEVTKLKKEAKAYEALGIDGGYIDKIPLTIPIIGAVVMKDQAQFHPLKYLDHLLKYIQEAGAQIYENTVAIDMVNGDPATVNIKNGAKVRAKYVISASHFPFHDGQAYFSRLYPKRSYVVAAKSAQTFPGGMYISAEKPTRSIRSVNINGEEALLVVGDGHKTGQGEPEIGHYEALEAFAKESFAAKEFLYRWSAQDLETPDKVPYIGRISEGNPNIFIASGYRKWGMSHGTAAGLLISDLIIGKENPYENLYIPTRFNADPSLKNIVKENLNVAAHLIGGKLERPDKEIKDIKEGEGAAITIKGRRAGAYKTESGELFVVETTCTHMGCEVNWNSGDSTWDCPCHGSRFSYEGEVVEGPADLPLKRIDPDSIDYTTSL